MTKNKWNENLLKEAEDSSTDSSIDTKSEELFDFESEVRRLKHRAQRRKEANNRLVYYAP